MKRLFLLLLILPTLVFGASVGGWIDGVSGVSPNALGTGGVGIANTGCVNIKDNNGTSIGVMCLPSTDILTFSDPTNLEGFLFDSNGIFKLNDTLHIKEQASKDSSVAAYGQIFVKTATPNTLHFVNDAGTEIELGAVGATVLVNDLTPQLGGNLDVNGKAITSTNGVIDILGPAGANNIVEIQATTGRTAFLRLAGFDIGHPITTIQPADVWLNIQPASAAAGGGFITAITDADVNVLISRAYSGSTSPTLPMFSYRCGKSDGSAGIASLAAAEICFQVSDELGGIDYLTIFGSGAYSIVSSATTQDAFLITANSLTTGEGLKIASSSSDNSTRQLVHLINSDIGSTGTTILLIEQVAPGVAFLIDYNADGVAFNIDKDVTDIDSATTNTITIISTQTVTDASTDIKSGTVLSILNEVTESNGIITDSGITVSISQTHDDATGDTVFINNDGTAAIALNIDSEATSKPVIQAVNAGALTQSVLTFGNAVDTIDKFITNATPESAITASIGDIAIDATGGVMYIKNSGTGTNTGWQSLSTDDAYSSLWYHGLAATVAITSQDTFTKVTVFANEGAEDPGGNVVGDATTDNDITIVRNPGTYEITLQASFTNEGGGPAEFHMGAKIILATAKTITDATNATPIVITSAAHGLKTGDHVIQANVGGNTAANGSFAVTELTVNTYSLQTSDHANVAGNGAYTSGGTVDAVIPGDMFMERIVSNNTLGRGMAQGLKALSIGDVIEMTVLNSDGTDNLSVTQMGINAFRVGN